MGKGTKAQLELANRLPNPCIGACRMPHCKTLQPAKGMYGGMCYFHARMIHYWAKKTGYDLRQDMLQAAARHPKWSLQPLVEGPSDSAKAYCDWLCQEAKRRFGDKE
jgi:hypothetical protein